MVTMSLAPTSYKARKSSNLQYGGTQKWRQCTLDSPFWWIEAVRIDGMVCMQYSHGLSYCVGPLGRVSMKNIVSLYK